MTIGYKITYQYYDNDIEEKIPLLTILKITGKNNENRKKNIYDKNNASYRCNEAVVLDTFDIKTLKKNNISYSGYSNKFVYEIGKTVTEPNYNNDENIVIGRGIHYYLTKERALMEFLENGHIYGYDFDGSILSDAFKVNGKLHGKIMTYYIGGGPKTVLYAKNGKIDKEFIEYDRNGNIIKHQFYEDCIPI